MEGIEISDELIAGVVLFGLMKLVGYYFVVAWVARYYRPHKFGLPLVVALSRVGLGALFAWLVASAFNVDKSLTWYLVLVSLRFVEWGLVFWYFYERATGKVDWHRLAMFSGFGAMASCVLDLPAAFSAIIFPLMAYGFC